MVGKKEARTTPRLRGAMSDFTKMDVSSL